MSPRSQEAHSKPTSSFYKQQMRSLVGVPAAQASPRTDNAERTSHSSETEVARNDLEFTSKLPAITDLINLKTKDLDPSTNSVILNLTKYAQNLEHIIRFKNKEIQRLEYINKYLVVSQQKRDEMLTHVLEENRRLKELTLKLEKKAADRRLYAKSLSVRNGPSSTTAQKHMQNQRIDETTKNLKAYTTNGERYKAGSSVRHKDHQTRMREEQREQDILIMNEDEFNSVFGENESSNILEDLLKNDEVFIDKVSSFDHSNLRKLYDAISDQRTINRSLKQMVFKLKRIIKATVTMTTSLVLDEAIEHIVDEICECLDCERASTFIYDNSKEELWTKAAKGSEETIRVPLGRGIVGHVFAKGEPLNILNAYTEEKFNKEIDIKTGYKTNTILAVPIKDDSTKDGGKRIMGVCQAVNKRGHNATFSKDDESLLTILSNLAGIVLRNSLVYDKQLSFHTSLRSALNDLIPLAEKKLKNLMGVEKAKIILKHPNQKELFSYLIDGNYCSYPTDCGIFGKVLKSGEFENVANAYNHPLFNAVVDVETSMPLLCISIKHPASNKVIGAIEVINAKGIQGLAALQRASVNAIDLETLDFFGKHLAQAVLNCFSWEKLECSLRGEKSHFEEND